jgi:hypothetical protein
MEESDEEFFEEYGEEMTKSFLNFGIHFKEYVCEMEKEICDTAMTYAHSFAEEYGIKVIEEEEFYYSPIDPELDDTDFIYAIINIYMKFADRIKEINPELWKKAVEYSSDYGGVGRVKFYHLKDEDKQDEKD